MSVSGFTLSSVSRHGNIRLRVAINQRSASSARRGLTFLFLKERQLFAKEEILRGKSAMGTGREENELDQVDQDRGCREETVLDSSHNEYGHERSGSHVTRRYDSVI